MALPRKFKNKTVYTERSRSAQDIQDEIFKKMSADRKLEIGATLWKFAKQLSGDNFNYATRINRPSKTTRQSGYVHNRVVKKK